MARNPMVTRTITTTKAKVLCLDILTGESVTKEIIVPRTFKDDKHLLKAIRKEHETDTVKVVHIVESEAKSALYGMTEQKFIDCADELPPRTED